MPRQSATSVKVLSPFWQIRLVVIDCSVMAMEEIRIGGARQHNLKNVSLTLPRNKLVVLTGVSGSGKSSLAFDTLYAEGQRRYVESLSTYARQYLEQMEKPDVDFIEGLSPAIAIEQRTAGGNPALDHRHHDGDPRFPAAALRAPRPAASSQNRQAAAALVGAADGRPRARREGRHAGADSRAGHPEAEGRVPRRGGEAAPRGIRPRALRRQDCRAGAAAAARQIARPHHRGGDRPAQDQRCDQDAPDRFARARAQDRRRRGHRSLRPARRRSPRS